MNMRLLQPGFLIVALVIGVQVSANELFLPIIPLPAKIMPIANGEMFEDNGAYPNVILDENGGIPHEGYLLHMSPNKIEITASTTQGIFYGNATLELMRAINAANDTELLPAVTIYDFPQYQYRGLLIDVARHFYDIEELKKVIDIMAMYKLNHLQLHLSDNQGFRLEIKKYPRLTEVGATRPMTKEEKKHYDTQDDNYGPFFYTQDEMRSLIEYAAQRHITIIPDIDLPGHALAMLAAYPELGCRGEGYEVMAKHANTEHVICPGSDFAMIFIKDVLTEIAELFPSQYIHTGGDEVWTTQWEKCPKCQDKMKRLELANVQELFNYMQQEINDIVIDLGRKSLLWDECLPAVPQLRDVAITSWRGIHPALTAAAANTRVIVSSNTHCYLNYGQGNSPEGFEPNLAPLRRLYSLDPGLGHQELTHDRVIGVQCNMWTENTPDAEQLFDQLLPRLAALAEVAWSPYSSRDLPAFTRRLWYNYTVWNALGITARFSAFDMTPTTRVPKGMTLNLDYGALPKNMEILYTTNDTDPASSQSVKKYSEQPPQIGRNMILSTRVLFNNEEPENAKSLNRWRFLFFPALAPHLAAEAQSELKPGFNADFLMSNETSSSFVANDFDFLEAETLRSRAANSVGTFSGYFFAPESGSYTFSIGVGGSLVMNIGEQEIINIKNSYVYMNREYSVALERGLHKWSMRAELGYPVSYSGRIIFNVALNGQEQKPVAQFLYH